MDLKSYAIMQKIQGKSELLKYLVDEKDVPVSVLEQSFGELIQDVSDQRIEAFSHNYLDYLQHHVRVGIVPLGENQFEVSGEIDQNEFEAIELLTGDSKTDVVSKLLDSVLSKLRGNKELTIEHIELSESEPIKRDLAEIVELDVPTAPVTEVSAEPVFPEMFDEEPELSEDIHMNVDDINMADINMDDINVDDSHFDVENIPEPLENDEFVGDVSEELTGYEADEVHTGDIEDELVEEPIVDTTEGESAINMTAVRDAYEKAVEAFKAIGFKEKADGKLALSI